MGFKPDARSVAGDLGAERVSRNPVRSSVTCDVSSERPVPRLCLFVVGMLFA